MPRRRLLWQLYPSYAVVALTAIVGLGFMAASWFEQFHLDEVRTNLAATARAVERSIDAPGALNKRDHLSAVCRQFAQATTAHVVVLSSTGNVIAGSDGPDKLELPPHAAVKHALVGKPWYGLDVSAMHDHRKSHAVVPMKRGGKIIGAVGATRSVATLDSNISSIRWRIVLVALCIAALAGVLSPLISRQVTRPIDEMRKAAERFARGDLDYKLSLPEAEELAALASALNQMAERLQNRIGMMVRQNNEQQAVLGSMIEGVLAVDNEQSVISLNKASAQLLAIDPLQARGRGLQEVVRNADLRRFITRTLAAKDPLEDDLVLRGNQESVLQARGAALHDGQGRAIGAVVVLNDVTDFRRLEHIRRDFVANVSHELKTPITSIKGFVETLLDGAIRDPVDADRFLRIIAKQADRLNSIIEDLLSLSKIEQGEETSDIALEPASLQEVLESAVHNCESQAADRNIRVRVNCPSGLAANINIPLLEEAVINLLDNAVKYSESGKEVLVSAMEMGDEVQIRVEDRGCGIPAEHLARIFERFYRVDKARSRKLGGTGLGLAIVKHIVQAHHGRVTVKSSPGIGSMFSIHLPLLRRSLPTSLAG